MRLSECTRTFIFILCGHRCSTLLLLLGLVNFHVAFLPRRILFITLLSFQWYVYLFSTLQFIRMWAICVLASWLLRNRRHRTTTTTDNSDHLEKHNLPISSVSVATAVVSHTPHTHGMHISSFFFVSSGNRSCVRFIACLSSFTHDWISSYTTICNAQSANICAFVCCCVARADTRMYFLISFSFSAIFIEKSCCRQVCGLLSPFDCYVTGAPHSQKMEQKEKKNHQPNESGGLFRAIVYSYTFASAIVSAGVCTAPKCSWSPATSNMTVFGGGGL